MKPLQKALIIRLSSIGDIVLTTPVVRVLKTQMNEVEIHYCTKSMYTLILADNPYIDKIIEFNGNLFDLIKVLRNEKYDLIIDLHRNFRTTIIKFFLGIKSISYNKLNLRKWIYVNFKWNLLPNIHIVERYLETLTPLGLKNDELGLDYFIPEKDEIDRDWLPETHRKAYAVVVVGAKYATKQLPYEKMIELCVRINGPIVLVGGEEDVPLANRIEDFFRRNVNDEEFEKNLKKLDKHTCIFNGCGKFNLNQSASIIRQAKMVFTHDTGLMHIAAAFKKETITFWGNTVPEFGMYPYRTNFTVYENKKLKCRPCSKIGFDRCPKAHFKCMRELKLDFYLPETWSK